MINYEGLLWLFLIMLYTHYTTTLMWVCCVGLVYQTSTIMSSQPVATCCLLSVLLCLSHSVKKLPPNHMTFQKEPNVKMWSIWVEIKRETDIH